MPNKVIVFPEYEKLKIKKEYLKKQLCDLLFERDNIVFVECKNIEAQYMIELGSLEIALYKIQCKVLRVKRKLSLIQQKINRREKIYEKEIEEILDIEFEEYKKQLEARIGNLNAAIDYKKATPLTENEAAELKQIYYKVIKKLHPDLNPDVTGAEEELFFKAVEAYNNGDICTMRIIGQALLDEDNSEILGDTIKELIKEVESLAEMVKNIEKDIEKIKSTFPYNALELLKDERKVKEKRLEYEKLIERETQLYTIYEEQVKRMLGS